MERHINVSLMRTMLEIEEGLLDWGPLPVQEQKRRITCIVNGEDYDAPAKGTPLIQHYRRFAEQHNGRTREVYLHTMQRLQAYDKDIDNLTLEDITAEWLAEYDAWLALTMPSANSRSIHLRNLRAVFNDCITRDLTTNYPFRRYRIRSQPTRHRALTVEQLRELLATEVLPHERRYLDMFHLMVLLCGISPVDLFGLKPADLRHGRIVTARSKTGQRIDIKVEPEAMDLIERYRGRDWLLNIRDEYRDYRDFLGHLNKALKTIGGSGYEYRKTRDGKTRLVAVRKMTWPDLSAYWARHTWASIAASLDIPKETIAQALGHSQRSVTDIYIAFDRSKVDVANRKVIDWIKADTTENTKKV